MPIADERKNSLPPNSGGDVGTKNIENFTVVSGYIFERVEDGNLIRRPASLAQQLASVQSVFGADFLKQPLCVILEPAILD